MVFLPFPLPPRSHDAARERLDGFFRSLEHGWQSPRLGGLSGNDRDLECGHRPENPRLHGGGEPAVCSRLEPGRQAIGHRQRRSDGQDRDAATGKEVFAFHGFDGPVRSVAWSPDGQHLAAGGEADTVKVWDAAKGQEIIDLKGKAKYPVAWSPDGKLLATGKENKNLQDFQVLDALTGREVRSFSANAGGIFSLAWSPDGKRLASSEYGNWGGSGMPTRGESCSSSGSLAR